MAGDSYLREKHQRLGEEAMDEKLVESFEIKKKFLGGYKVVYNCPYCDAELTSQELEIRSEEHCPECEMPFYISYKATQEIESLRYKGKKQRRGPNRKDYLQPSPIYKLQSPSEYQHSLGLKRFSWRHFPIEVLIIGGVIVFAIFESQTHNVQTSQKHRLPEYEIEVNNSTRVPQTNAPLLNVDQETNRVMNQLMSTPAGRSEVERIGSKDEELTRFQEANGISDQIADAAIKEWVITHNGNFDWNLTEVKAICLRMR